MNQLMNIVFTVMLLTIVGCGGHDHGDEHGETHGKHQEELAASAVTQWTAKSELFSENKALVVLKETPFAVHLTDLNGFKPVTQGQVKLVFKNPQGEEVFIAKEPSHPGIFRPIAKVSKPGKYQVKIILEGSLTDEHDLGEMTVYPSIKEAPKEQEEEEASSSIPFLKEQQWKGGFDVKEIEEKELYETIVTQAEVRAPLNSFSAVIAPVSGEVVAPAGGFPLLGAGVKGGQVLFEIKDQNNHRTPIVSTHAGIVSLIHVGDGDQVEKERKLVDLINLKTIWIEVKVYESDMARLTSQASAIIEIPGSSSTLQADRLVSTSGSLDTVSRTVSMIFEAKNPPEGLMIGSHVKAYIRTQKSKKTPVIPMSALVDEDGKMVAYVQTEGEAFEKRELTLGIREGNLIQVLSGLQAKEYVVTEGAYSIRLMSVSSQLPAHGHAH
jgi:membrane fusion protein, heavy metal efflux system